MEILRDDDVASAVVRLVEEAEKAVVLVSPYFRPWKRLTMVIEQAMAGRKVRCVVLVRGGEDAERQFEAARPLAELGAWVGSLERLHAKVYLSEKAVIVTSMNLLDASATGSWEVAVRFDRKTDEAAYRELTVVVQALLDRAGHDAKRQRARAAAERRRARHEALIDEAVRVLSEGGASVATPAERRTRATPNAYGWCIRCGRTIAFDPERPYCRSCYRDWRDDQARREDHCHRCGRPARTSLDKPLCYACFKSTSVVH